jgi:hypothetical protein
MHILRTCHFHCTVKDYRLKKISVTKKKIPAKIAATTAIFYK